MRDLKFGIVIQHLEPGGIEYLALEFLKKFPFGLTELIVLEGNKSCLENWSDLSPYRDQIHFLEKKPGWDIALVSRLKRLFISRGYHLIHSHHIGPMLYGGVAAKLCGIAHIHTEHDAWHLENLKRRALQKMALVAFNPTVIADAQHVAENFSYFTQRAVNAVILNGIDTDHFSPKEKCRARQACNLPTNGFIFGTAGRLASVKNQSLLIKAFAQISTRNCYLAIAGQGPEEAQLKSLAHDLGLADRVLFLGHLSNMEVFYSAIDRFVLTSLNEGFPLCLVEAQASGTAVIASDVGGVAEAVCPTSGQLFPSNCLTSLVDLMTNSLSTKINLEKPRAFSLHSASQETMFKAYNAVYAKALQ